MANTPLPNENYDVVSVLYHLLQGSDVIEQYCSDADNAKDDELTSFFREVQETTTRWRARHRTSYASAFSDEPTGNDLCHGGHRLLWPGLEREIPS
jgi:hypothetical protein